MRVARIDRFGGPEVLRLADVPIPTPGAGEVLVKVYGSSINPADVAVRNGWMHQYIPMSLPLTVGTDVAGIVAEVGDGVSEWASGDPVYGAAGVMMGGSGGFAELSVTRPGLLAVPPAGVDLRAAATLPLAGVAQPTPPADRARREARSQRHPSVGSYQFGRSMRRGFPGSSAAC